MLGAKQVDVWQKDQLTTSQLDWVAEEVPIALVYNGISHVVMMATPDKLEEFAIGFSLAEGVIESINDIYSIECATSCQGIEVQVELSTRRFVGLKEKRRAMTGRTGCGVCGVEQIEGVVRPLPPLPFSQTFHLKHLDAAIDSLKSVQNIGQLTGCTHAAAWIDVNDGMLGGCEDVGRHVALDKLLGIRAQQGWQKGAVLVSSRASYEMVQKSATCGVEILFAASAATSLAIEVAEKSNLTLVGFSKRGRATVYTHPQRLI